MVAQDHSFCHIKQLLTQAPVLAFPNFDKVFKVEIDANMTGIGAVLLQDGQPLEFFSEKFNKARQKWTTYEQELFAIVRAFQHWEYFLVHSQFVLHCDHHALQFLNSKMIRPNACKMGPMTNLLWEISIPQLHFHVSFHLHC